MNRALLLTTKLLAAAILVVAVSGAAAVITRVTVLNAKFEQIRTLANPNELERFNLLFTKKKEANPPDGLEWIYKLDLKTEKRGSRWLYQPDGWLRVLSKAKTPVYKLESPEEFRKLLLG